MIYGIIIGFVVGVLATLYVQAVARYEKDRYNLVKMFDLDDE